MAVINILDKSTAELIAAGEVVEKPASVVKELVENSIDAGAKNITVDIENGGIKKILVQDDGCGIDSEYVATAFIRHATSKISNKEDLDSIASLGFRGEALASIASVSRVTLTTKTDEQDFGVEYVIEGGEEKSIEIKPFVNGTRFIIRDLFYNTPARMKFLKKDATEAGYINEILTNLALSNPHISFTFKKDGKVVFTTAGDGELKNTIASLFSASFAKEICAVDYSDGKYVVKGFATYPHYSRQSRNMQFAFINGRYVKNKTVLAAVENAYKGTVMVGKFPGYVLDITMPFDCVDVNVHPAKTEVRFANESEVFSAVYRAVKNALADNQDIKQVNIKNTVQQKFFVDTENIKQQTIQSAVAAEAKTASAANLKISINPVKETFKTVSAQEFRERYQTDANVLKNDDIGISCTSNPKYEISGGYTSYSSKKDIFIPYEEPEKAVKAVKPQEAAAENTAEYTSECTSDNHTEEKSVVVQHKTAENDSDFMYDIRVVGEVFNTYILCESSDSLVVIDKHAAHERILYEKLKKNQNNDNQMLLSPVGVNLSAREKEAVMDNIKLLEDNGFIIDDMGIGGVIVRAVPMNISSEDPQSLVEEIAHNLSQGNSAEISEKQEWIFHSVACRSAIKAGDKATEYELKRLVQDIIAEKIPLYCPHGRPVIISLTKKEIERQFGRA
ncbi:MAG: DNA mismatch repair endonuclease MutL [Oscillospiraceae bacterium]|nr:DNA mismatch repair endonuclease MutL [Oscillospiraceae bacterium]